MHYQKFAGLRLPLRSGGRKGLRGYGVTVTGYGDSAFNCFPSMIVKCTVTVIWALGTVGFVESLVLCPYSHFVTAGLVPATHRKFKHGTEPYHGSPE